MIGPYRPAANADPQTSPAQITGAISRGLLPQGIAICLLLYGISEATSGSPEVCWWVSWLSGCVLLALSLGGVIFEIPRDLPWRHQILRPWFLVLSIFSGYNFLTSIFYWLDLHGHFYIWERARFVFSSSNVRLAAIAQQHYLLAQIGLVLGVGCMLRWRPATKMQPVFSQDLTRTLLTIASAALFAMFLFRMIPGLSQLMERAQGVMVIAIATSLGIAYRTNSPLLSISFIANSMLAVLALASGWKEEVLVLVILNAVAFFPRHPMMTSVVTFVLFLVGFVLLPPLANEIRKSSWKGKTDQLTGLQNAIAKVQTKTREELTLESWEFLTGRLSEEGLFVRYLAAVPSKHDFYGTSIASQSLLGLVPRALWPSKPNVEKLVHKRVVELGVISAKSSVSAKPQFIVDAYLSFGKPGVFGFMFLLGCVTQVCMTLCELNLGGIVLGGVFFNGLFSQFWRGNCFEFMFSSVIWSLVTLALVYVLMQQFGLLKKIDFNSLSGK